ncbi:MAG: stalk domain-containing protein [Firmicutes bacterium]|nr:stalk domain-containing protein [Bacillota bacterium]
MKQKVAMLKGIVVGVLVTVLLTGTVVMANPVTRNLVFGITVTVNGEEVDFAEDSLPFVMGNRTFLPVAAMAEIFNFQVSWDRETNTANLIVPEQPAPPPPCPPCPPAPTCPEDTAPAIIPITVAEITALQVAWGEGLVAISTAYANDEDYASIAQSVLDTLYGYVDGYVLFKPTIAQEVPFRFTEAAAASYFIGGGYIDEDGGFALNPWTAVRFGDDGQHIIRGETALWMGSVYLTNGDGEVTRVEKSLGFYRDSNGDVRILLHHSSVPFTE